MMRLYSYLPTLDLHGMDREYATYKVDEFIKDNYKMKNKKVIIIHGIGTGIVKTAVHNYLRKSKLIKTYKLDNFNNGQTIVEMK